MSNGDLQQQLIANSVTRDEVELQRPQDGLVRIAIGAWGGVGTSTVMQLLPDLPPFWSHWRDNILVSTITVESHWAQAVGLAVMTFCTRSWDVDGEVPLLQLERNRKRFRGVDYVGSVSRGVTDYMLRDNGWWMEIVRPTDRPTGVIGLRYLSSARCMPTGYDPIPCVYWDRLGHPHELKDYQVMRVVDMPDGAHPFGVGVCAARRAYNDIRTYAAAQRYRLEKMTANRPLAIEFLTGVTPKQLKGALADHEQQQAADNIIAYGGVVIVPMIQREGIARVTIPIVSLPDGFNNKEEVQMTSIAYGNALPLITYLQLMPMMGRTVAQSQVIDDTAEHKDAILNDITLKFNDQELYKLTSDGVTFFFKKNDLADRKREADIINVFATAAAHLIKDCGFNPALVLKWLVDNDIMPPDDNPDEQFGSLGASENAVSNPKAIASPTNAKPAVSGDAKTVLNDTAVATKGIIMPEQLAALGNELRTVYRSQQRVPPERIAQLIAAHISAPATPPALADDTMLRQAEALRLFATNSIATKQQQIQPVFNVMLPPSTPNPTPIVNVTNHVPVPSVNVQNDNHLPHTPAPAVNVHNVLPPLAPIINLPEAQVTITNTPAAPVVNNIVTPAPIGEMIETIDVTQRDKDGLLERLIKRTVRK